MDCIAILILINSNVKEIYPPKLSDFAYITDNTCCEEDILNMELDLMIVKKRKTRQNSSLLFSVKLMNI